MAIAIDKFIKENIEQDKKMEILSLKLNMI